MSIAQEIILHNASFNPKVKTYIYFVVLFYLITSIIGIILVPFWLLGLGQWLSAKFYKTLTCQLTNKNLKFSKGIILHIEKTIPLDNIQDLSFIGGPLLRSFGLTMIKVETAGGGGTHSNNNMMSMIGVIDAEKFKSEILLQREKVIQEKFGTSSNKNQSSHDHDLLNDIKSELVGLNSKLESIHALAASSVQNTHQR
ncbi:MAG TPA: PH domain-containing protein [Chitinophagaceae bacterium]|nr:PH domain-containing protein [Chitinophagaceae bacterium]